MRSGRRVDRRSSCQAGNEQAGAEVDERLQVQHRVIICHAEERKAERQKSRIAGQAHQRRLDGGEARRVAHGVAVDAVGEPVGGNVSVEQRIALDLRVRVDKPQAQSGSGGEHNQGKQEGMHQHPTSERPRGVCVRPQVEAKRVPISATFLLARRAKESRGYAGQRETPSAVERSGRDNTEGEFL